LDFDFNDFLKNLNNGLYIVDKKRKILFWNKMAEKITGYMASDIVGSYCYDNILMHIDAQGRHLCTGLCPLDHTIKDGHPRYAEIFLHHKDGHRIPVIIRTTPLRDSKRNIIGAAELFSESCDKDRLTEKIHALEKLALIDHLTGLPNRLFIEREIVSDLNEMERSWRFFAILFLDIDNFKDFNDRYGHASGDMILKTISKTLLSNSRPYDVFGRWGGEEFLGIIRNVDIKQLREICERYRILIEESKVEINGKQLNVTVSIGAVMARVDDTVQSLVDRADAMMYESKKKGKNRVSIQE